MQYLGEELRISFPRPEDADGHGIVAAGGNLSPGVLLSAYEQGIFPWYEEDPILWFSPDPRFLLRLESFHVGRRLRRTVKSSSYRISFDHAFDRIIAACRAAPRNGQHGTWITEDMQRAYIELHALGHAHSVGVWDGERLIGGLYGVGVGSVFAGESMFSSERDASKFAVIALAGVLWVWGVDLIDSQMETRHMRAFGGQDVPRDEYLTMLADRVDRRRIPADWSPADGQAALAAGLELSTRTNSHR